MQPDVHANAAERTKAAHDAIERFLSGSKSPALLEPGEAQLPLVRDSYEVSYEAGRLSLQAWDRERTILRRITRVLHEKPGEVELETERFGKKTGTLKLLDTARPQSQGASRRGERLAYREVFRRSLARQFTGWTIAEVSTEPDLEHTLSPAYARGLLRKGASGVAAIGAAPESLDVDGVLTFGLIWLDYLRARERKITVDSLVIFVPEGRHRTTCVRVRHLRSDVSVSVFAYAPGYEQKLDLADHGNLDTDLAHYNSQFSLALPDSNGAIASLLAVDGVEAIECVDGSLSIRMRGLEFARKKDGCLSFGLETKTPAGTSNLPEIESLARHLSGMRVHNAPHQSSLYSRSPELWLESQVRRSISKLDATLRENPVYGQVPAFAGGERGVIDLLAAGVDGRLAVLELKASEDVHLPLQALDYWMRVNWHAAQNRFSQQGYFPGLFLSKAAPRLLLVAPALDFHPSTETILKYFSPEIEVERIGVGMDWRRELLVAFRLIGAETRA